MHRITTQTNTPVTVDSTPKVAVVCVPSFSAQPFISSGADSTPKVVVVCVPSFSAQPFISSGANSTPKVVVKCVPSFSAQPFISSGATVFKQCARDPKVVNDIIKRYK